MYVGTGSVPLRFVNEPNYLGFSFCNLNKDDKDIIRPMRLYMYVVIVYFICLLIYLLM